MTGEQLYDILSKHVGERYVFGIVAPKDDPTYRGPWDCAEFASWGIYQISGKLYGCANNNGNAHTADAYSGFWARDADVLGKKIPLTEGVQIPGAAFVRLAGNGIVGHVAIGDGTGHTVEAHSTRTGVIHSVVNGRRWDYVVLVPWLEYTTLHVVPAKYVHDNTVYRYTKPLMHAPIIAEIQKRIGIAADGLYGLATFNAVRAYQLQHGLNPDGEVGPLTLASLRIPV